MRDGAGRRLRKTIFFMSLTAISSAGLRRVHWPSMITGTALGTPSTPRGGLDVSYLRCGFSGPRWSDSDRQHFEWCMQTDMQIVESEKRERNYAVACCKYAVEATAQVLQAAQRNCGYSGARWSPNQQEHLNWCLAAAKGFPEFEAQQRDAGLQSCGQRR